MSESRNRVLRGGLRAVTGVLIVGVAATVAVMVGAAPLPSVTREPVALRVDTKQGGERTLVCAGSFAELGADSRHPGDAVPSGTVGTVVSGAQPERGELERERSGGSAPEVLRVAAGSGFAAAQTQAVQTETLRGLTAQSCAEPVNEQWLVGGTTMVGSSTTVNLGNPSEKPATVQLTVFDENGRVDSAQTSGVLVPAGSERVVSMNGYAPSRERIAVRVVSTGAAVTASLGVAQVTGLQSFSVDTVTRQLAADTTLVVPGVTNLGDGAHSHGETGDADEFQVVVRALSTTGRSGTATVRAVLGDGTSTDLGTLDLAGAKVGELTVKQWPEKANAVVIDADVPIVGGVLGQAAGTGQHDTAWFTPAPRLPADTEIAAAVVDRGQLVLTNPGTEDATVRLGASAAFAEGSATPPQEYRVPAGAAIAVSTPGDSVILSSAPIYAGVRIALGGDIAGYPVLAEQERVTAITVYPR